MARKTIDDIRYELRREKEKTRKLREQLAAARIDTWIEATKMAMRVAADYPVDLFPPPDPNAAECAPDRYSAAGARLAATRIADECARRMKAIS
jgi:hypothetical protein